MKQVALAGLAGLLLMGLVGADSCATETSDPNGEDPSSAPASSESSGSSSSAGPSVKRIGSGKANGDYAIASATGTAVNPTSVYLKVSAEPAQSGTVTWTMVCVERGGGVGSKDGQTQRELPAKVRMPLPDANPESCDVSANVQLDGSGKVKIAIYRKR